LVAQLVSAEACLAATEPRKTKPAGIGEGLLELVHVRHDLRAVAARLRPEKEEIGATGTARGAPRAVELLAETIGVAGIRGSLSPRPRQDLGNLLYDGRSPRSGTLEKCSLPASTT